jgi:hypothetical protein
MLRTLALLATLLPAVPVLGQSGAPWELAGDVVSPALADSDIGSSMTFDGDDALWIGQPFLYFNMDERPPAQCGELRLYRPDDSGGYAYQGSLTATDAVGSCKTGDMFGGPVKIVGDRMFVAAPAGLRTDGQAREADARIFVFERDAAQPLGWRGAGEIAPDQLAANHGFGVDFDTDGDTLIVQRYAIETLFGIRFARADAVYVFEREGAGAADFAQLQLLEESRPYYGFDLVVAGEQLLISAPETVQSQNQGPGRVYVYERGATNWVGVQDFAPGTPTNFGYSLSVQGDTLAVGTPGIFAAGAAFIYRRGADARWSQAQMLVPEQTAFNDIYGLAVTLTGDELYVGAENGDRQQPSGRGALHHYRLQSDGRYTEVQRLTAPDDVPNDIYGNQVAVGEHNLIVSSRAKALDIGSSRTALFHYTREGGAAFEIDAGSSGLWFNSARSGEGFAVEVLDAASAWVIWFTHDLDGSQLWLVGLGTIDGGRIVVDEMLRASASGFGAGFDPDSVELQRWGRLELSFSSCDAGAFNWSADGYGSGGYALSRLASLSGVACGTPAAKVVGPDHSGHFFDPANAGQGLTVFMVGASAAPQLYWYSFDTSGKPMWLISVAQREADAVLVDRWIRPQGARFGAAFDPADVVLQDWGNGRLDFSGCNAAAMGWNSALAGYGSGSLDLARLTLPSGVNCAP